jgi:hypothetical protein
MTGRLCRVEPQSLNLDSQQFFSTGATQSKINLGDGVKVNTLCAGNDADARISL